jgi:predicted  nucleic acid-binding Zn-ribbon protein
VDSFFAHPEYFYALLAALLLISLFAIFSMGQEEKKASKVQIALLADIRARAAELEKNLQQKELEYKESAGSFQKTLQEKDAEFSGRISEMEAKLAAAAELKLRLAGFESALAEKEDRLNKANKELALSNQMYNGLKEQYDELEEKFSQLFEEFLKEQKNNLPGQTPKALPEEPQTQIKLPKIPNLRSDVEQESQEPKLPPKES